MCDRAGIGAVWADDSAQPGQPPPRLEALTALAALAPATARVRLGAMLLAARRPAPLLAAMAGTLAALTGGRVEVSVLGVPDASLRSYTDEFREALEQPEGSGEPHDGPAGRRSGPVPPTGAGEPHDGPAGRRSGPVPPTGAGEPQGGAPVGGDRLTVGVEVGDPERLDPEQVAWLAGVADDLLLTAADVERVAECARQVRAACELAGREPGTLGIAARLPVSVGRTVAEARARWDAEPAFAALGPPERAGVFGTLEQCHERVISLAHAGVTDLRCVLPNAADVHDVIAQVTAMSIGTVDKLAPGAPRSPAPPPPEGWGGRPRFPSGVPEPPPG